MILIRYVQIISFILDTDRYNYIHTLSITLSHRKSTTLSCVSADDEGTRGLGGPDLVLSCVSLLATSTANFDSTLLFAPPVPVSVQQLYRALQQQQQQQQQQPVPVANNGVTTEYSTIDPSTVTGN
eukprot:965380_1